MAYYNSSYSEANSGEYSQTPYYAYNYNDFSSFQYDSAPCYAAYDPEFCPSNAGYSCYTFSEPNYVEFALNPYGDDFGTVKTRFTVSYSVLEFNVPEFEEYDPTPYGGGYDPDAAYGKPLPPSEGICYPRSSKDPNDESLIDYSYGSIESPYGKGIDKPIEKPSNVSEVSETGTFEDHEQQTQGSNEHVNVGSKGEESREDDHDVYGKGDVGDNGTDYEKRVTQIPPGYGLEAMDLCESLFGYWPCLARAKRENDCRNCYGSHGVCTGWEEETADYLFGDSYPSGERWSLGGIYENPIFNYERHYQEQSLSLQMEYQEDYSWLN